MYKAHHDPKLDKYSIEEGYELRDVNTPFMYKVAVWLLILIVFSFGSMSLMFDYMYSADELQDASRPSTVPSEPPPLVGPQLQATPRADMEALNAQHALSVMEYGVVNPELGTARIPVEKAIEQVLEKGLPIWKQLPGPEVDETDPFQAAQNELQPDTGSGVYEILYRK